MEVETQRWNTGRPIQPVAVRCGPISPEEEERTARIMAEVKAEWDRKLAEADPEEEEEDDDVVDPDEARRFRDTWNARWSGHYGSFEDTTKIPCMRFTYKKPAPYHSACARDTLQIFSLKIAGIRGGLQWPLHVFGKAAVRDTVDHNRNVIFDRTRDDCQILSQEVPYLKLTGPARAVVLADPVTFEVDLKVKGTTESEDEDFSFLAVTFTSFSSLDSHLHQRYYTSKLSTLQFELGTLVYSVEATISVRITHGAWPNGFRAQFVAYTDSIAGAEVILFDSGEDEVPVDGDGSIVLSRRVVSVEIIEQLNVCVKAWQGDGIVAERKKRFKPKRANITIRPLNIGFCKMDVTVAWSLVSSV